MEAIAKVYDIRITARKTRLVANLIRDKKVSTAIKILHHTNKKSAPIFSKLLHSAISNATNNFQMNADLLFIKSVVVNEGKTLKRIRPRAKGRSYKILKRSSHIEIIVSDGKKDSTNKVLVPTKGKKEKK